MIHADIILQTSFSCETSDLHFPTAQVPKYSQLPEYESCPERVTGALESADSVYCMLYMFVELGDDDSFHLETLDLQQVYMQSMFLLKGNGIRGPFGRLPTTAITVVGLARLLQHVVPNEQVARFILPCPLVVEVVVVVHHYHRRRQNE